MNKLWSAVGVLVAVAAVCQVTGSPTGATNAVEESSDQNVFANRVQVPHTKQQGQELEQVAGTPERDPPAIDATVEATFTASQMELQKKIMAAQRAGSLPRLSDTEVSDYILMLETYIRLGGGLSEADKAWLRKRILVLEKTGDFEQSVSV